MVIVVGPDLLLFFNGCIVALAFLLWRDYVTNMDSNHICNNGRFGFRFIYFDAKLSVTF